MPLTAASTSRVLGVDPGTLLTGWGLVGGTSSSPTLIECGVIRLRHAGSMARRLALIHEEIATLVVRLAPTVAAVEAPFHGVSARAALQLAHGRGAVLAALGSGGLEVAEYSPAQVKKSLVGSGRADKAQVGTMVARLLGESPGVRTPDVSDALAVALCHLAVEGFAAAVARSEGRR